MIRMGSKISRADKFRRFNHTLNSISKQKRCFNNFVSKELRPMLKHDLCCKKRF